MSKVKIFSEFAHDAGKLVEKVNTFMESVEVKNVVVNTAKSDASDHTTLITVYYTDKEPEKGQAGFVVD